MIVRREATAAILFTLLSFGPLLVGAQENKDQPRITAESQPPARSKLDEELLKDLGPDPLLPEVEPAAPAADEPSASKKKEGPEQQLLQGLSDGEDLGEPGEAAANPLAKIGQQMRDVERAISQRQADQETRRRQARIVRELDDLIRQAQQQKKNNSNKSNSNNNRSTAGMERSGGQNQQQPARRPDVAQPGANAGEGKSAAAGAARDSEKRTTEQQSQKPDMVKMRDVLKGVWGELPERRREQMLQSYEEQFLPKYEQMIADYFRSLSDEKERKR